jgi:hypothetical protein
MLSTIKQAIKGIVTEFKAGYNASRTTATPTPITTTGINYEALITTMLRDHDLSADLYVRDYALGGMVMCVLATEDKASMNIHVRTHTDTLLVVDPIAVRSQYLTLAQMYPAIFGTLTLEDMATMIAAHELGHIKARHIHSNEHAWKKELIYAGATVTTHRADYMKMGQMTINQELDAWHVGKQYVSAHLLDAYNAFNRVNVNSYKSLFNKELGTNTYR